MRQGVDLRFTFLLSSSQSLVGASLISKSLIGMSSAISSHEVISSYFLGSILILKFDLDISKSQLDTLDGLLAFHVSIVSMLKSSFKICNISLQLLFHAQSFNLSFGLRFKGHLHALNCLAKVLLGGGKLFILLGKSALNLLLNLGEFKLCSKHLVLLLFKSSLSFRQSSFKLHLFSLKTLADFVNLMDGASTLADLVHDILDFSGKGLVLTSYFIKLKNRFFICILHTEEF